MPNIAEMMAPALQDAARIMSLLQAVDSGKCIRLHRRMAQMLNRSRTGWADQVYVLTVFLASIIEQIDPDEQEMLAGDIPMLIDLARERVAAELRHDD